MTPIALAFAFAAAASGPALLADASTDVLAGNGGWAGAGLLGLVLAWLLWKHLPAMFDRHDKHVADLTALHKEQMAATHDTFKASLQAVVEHCESEARVHAAAFREEVAKMTGAIEKIQAGGSVAVHVAASEKRG
jgi:ABC-type nickel/cobalt efflux system permease component RcnA